MTACLVAYWQWDDARYKQVAAMKSPLLMMALRVVKVYAYTSKTTAVMHIAQAFTVEIYASRFSKFRRLQHLDLSSNFLGNLASWRRSSLTSVDLSKEYLRASFLTGYRHWQSLRYTILHQNSSTGTAPALCHRQILLPY
jgi:hypothetical protein